MSDMIDTDRRATEADVLNTELRENYGTRHQVEPDDDWRPAIKALVDGVRYGERFQLTRQLTPAREAWDKYRHMDDVLCHQWQGGTAQNYIIHDLWQAVRAAAGQSTVVVPADTQSYDDRQISADKRPCEGCGRDFYWVLPSSRRCRECKE